MSTGKDNPSGRSPGASTSFAAVTFVALGLMAACVSSGSAQMQADTDDTRAERKTVQRQQQEERPDPDEDERDRSSRKRPVVRQDEESVYEGIPAPDEPEEDDLILPDEGYLWGGRSDRRPDPTVTAEGALTVFMRARNYRTIRILKSVMTPSLQASYDRDSARFNGKQNVRLSAFYFEPEDLKAVHYSGPKGAREADIFDATVRSLWTHQGELADRRREVIRLAQEESGLWRVGRLDIRESDKSRYQEQIPSVTSLRKVLRAWHRRQTALALPLLTEAFREKYAAEAPAPEAVVEEVVEPEKQAEESGVAWLFEGDPEIRHAAFEIREILWEEEADEATAHVDLYVTASNRFGPLQPLPYSIRLVQVGVGWYIDSWEAQEETASAGL